MVFASILQAHHHFCEHETISLKRVSTTNTTMKTGRDKSWTGLRVRGRITWTDPDRPQNTQRYSD